MTQNTTTESPQDEAVVVYHDNCIDGFTSAFVFHKLAESGFKSVKYLPCKYGDHYSLHLFQDKTVYILDFSFPRDILETICEAAEFVFLLDHHKTAQADLENTENWPTRPKNLYIEFDMKRSGAGMTWDYFASRVTRPNLVNYVEDRDLWRFAFQDSKEVNAYIAATDKTFEAYDLLADRLAIPGPCANIGSWLLRQHQKICEELVELARPFEINVMIDGVPHEFNGLSVNTNGQFASEVGNLLAITSRTFGATYYTDRDGSVKFSLRSVGDYDVSKLAKIFGGGGHRNAAGFSLKEEGSMYQPVMEIWSYVPVDVPKIPGEPNGEPG